MEISKRVAAGAAVVCIVVGGIVGSKLTKVTPQIETVIKDRVVTVVRQIKSPDGTIVTDVRQTEDRQQRQTVAPPKKPDWHISASYQPSGIPVYGVQLERRILGDVYLGVSVNTEGRVMGIVGFSF